MITRVSVLVTILLGIAFGQTPVTVCTLSNGVATGFFGGVNISGSYTSNTSNISAIEFPGTNQQHSYTFTGPLDGPKYTQTSKIPPVPCIVEFCTPGSFVGPGTATLSVYPNDTNTAADLGFEDTGELFSGAAALSCVTSGTPPPPPPPPPPCGPFKVILTGNGTPTINASYTPANGMDLDAAATACGYIGFDWEQQVTNLPCPSPNTLKPNNSSGLPSTNYCGAPTLGSLTVGGSAPAFNDPPPSGYYGFTYNPNPFYYNLADAMTINNPAALNPTKIVVNDGGTTLQFADTPRDFCLPTGPLSSHPSGLRNTYCGGYLAVDAPSSSMGFETALVGIVDSNTPSPALFPWTWTSNYNGLAGGVTLPGLSSAGPATPGSGYGGITITSINGVPVPPIVPFSQIAITASGLAYSRVSKTFVGTVTIKNIGSTTITTPPNFQLVLTALPSGVTLANSAGTFNGSPYITVPTVASLAAGGSVTVAVQFSNPSNVVINFTPEFYAGSF